MLTLPVSIATTKRAFSIMKLVERRLHNTMEDELLVDNIVVYTKMKIAKNIIAEMIMDKFYSMKDELLV